MKESLSPGSSRKNLAHAYALSPEQLRDPNRLAVMMPLWEFGHVIPTLKFAKRLQDDGWRVVYLVGAYFHDFLNARGFECREVEISPEEKATLSRSYQSIPRHTLYEKVRRPLLQELKPTLALTDLFNCADALTALDLGIRLSTYTILNDAERRSYRPMIRGYPSPRSLLGRFLMRLDWINIMRVRESRRFVTDPEALPVTRYLRKRIRRLKLNMPHYSWPGVCYWIDPLVFGPRSLSYDTFAPERYCGFCVGNAFGANSPEIAQFLKRPGKLVYLSFGSLSSRYDRAKEIFVRIATCLGGRRGYKLIVQAGDFTEQMRAYERDNVLVAKKVDQINLIKSADVAIIHGGYGSFKECVAAGVPFLVCPFFYDQHGNARHAMDLGIGERIKPSQFDEGAFLELLERLAIDPGYRERLAALWDPEQDEREFETAYQAFVRRLGQGAEEPAARRASSAMAAGER